MWRLSLLGGLESLEIAAILRVKVSIYHIGVSKSTFMDHDSVSKPDHETASYAMLLWIFLLCSVKCFISGIDIKLFYL